MPSKAAPTATVDREALRAASQFVGTVDQEIELDVRVNLVQGPFPSQYGNGERYVYLLGDEARNAIRAWGGRTFKGPGGLSVAPVKGDRMKIAATVQRHEEYKGEKQTTLTKVRVLSAN